jgi:hypothetical protein
MNIKKNWKRFKNTQLMRRLGKVAKRVRQYAGYMREDAVSNLKDKAGQIGKAFMKGEKPSIHTDTHRERPFSRENGGADIKHVVWAGHTVKNSVQQSQYGAVGLTENGYYRTAQVQSFGGIEQWNWSADRHVEKQGAISVAEYRSAESLAKTGGAKKVVDRSSVIAEMSQKGDGPSERVRTGSYAGKSLADAGVDGRQKPSSTGASKKYGRPTVANKAQFRKESHTR